MTVRLRGTLVSGGIAVGALGLALLGGAVSGKLEHRPDALPPPVPTTTSTTTSTTVPDSAAVALVRAQVVEDMSLDVQSQRLDPDPRRRAAVALTPGAVAARHSDIAIAWVPEKVADLEAAYDRLVHANALNPAAYSVTESQFVVTAWEQVSVTGVHATALLTGHYRLTEPTNHSVAGGIVDQPDTHWTITARLVDGRWRLEDKTAT